MPFFIFFFLNTESAFKQVFLMMSTLEKTSRQVTKKATSYP